MLTFRGLDRVLGDLSEMGYDARWGVVGAYHVGAPHRRERIWIIARRGKFLSYSQHKWIGRGEQQQESVEEKTGYDVAFSKDERTLWGDWSQRNVNTKNRERGRSKNIQWWNIEPELGRVANGVADRVDRLKAIGNGQVPLCAATAWRILSENL